jgi:uncharacterized protein
MMPFLSSLQASTHSFDGTPFIAAACGGILIGLSAVLLMWLFGRIAGISGIAATLLTKAGTADGGWRISFIAGLVLAGFLLKPFTSATPLPATSPAILVTAGLLVGFGSVLGSGCTSGHGVCGLGRRSLRSAAAVAIFMGTAFVTVFLLRHVFI